MSRPHPLRRPTLRLVPWSLLLLLGCGGLSDGDVPPPDALVLDINGERSVDHIRGSLLVTVHATGATPDKVELLHNGETLATLLPPFQYTLDATTWKEGSYRLSARGDWKGRTFNSPVHTVVVDRTQPTVERTWPYGSNVSKKEGSELRVTFSEPMLESSLRSDLVKQGSISLKGTLSEDGRVLTVPYPSPVIGTHEATLNLEGPTDLAGNSLAQPGGAKALSWTWSLPAFWQVSASAEPSGEHTVKDGVSLALGADGSPLVAYSAIIHTYSSSEPPMEGERLVVKRWGPSGWSLFGNPQTALHATAATTVRNPLVVMGTDGNPVVAFIQGVKDEARDSLHVSRWDGVAWRLLGERVTGPEVTTVHGAALVMDRQGRPVVAWSSVDGVHVARWESARWVELDGAQRATLVGEGRLAPQAPALAVDADDHVVVAWAESEKSDGADLYVRRWDGTAWAPLGGKLEGHTLASLGVRFPSLVIRPDNQPEVIWSMGCESCTPGLTWVYTATWSGTSWGTRPLSDSNALGEVRGTAIAIDGQGRTLHAWNGGSRQEFGVGIHVSWYPYSDYPLVEAISSSGSSGRLSMVVDARDRPVVAMRSYNTAYVIWKNE